MRIPERLVFALLLVILPVGLHAQSWEQQMLPLRFARVNARVRRRLRSDWDNEHDAGYEWAYCVAGWVPEKTRDGDTVFVVDSIARVGVRGRAHAISGFECGGPTLHVHPSGDCTPSRADISTAVARPESPFHLIMCGAGALVSYDGEPYRRAIAAGGR